MGNEWGNAYDAIRREKLAKEKGFNEIAKSSLDLKFAEQQSAIIDLCIKVIQSCETLSNGRVRLDEAIGGLVRLDHELKNAPK